MSKINFIKKIHFVGAGGISMSALAKLMLLMGKQVSGSDISYSEELCTLNQWGADIWVGHQPESIAECDVLVYTLAVPEHDPEILRAKELNIPCISRHHFLAEIVKDYNTVIGISGTHGKTTTTGMLACIFHHADECFTAHIGGNIAGGIGNIIYKGYSYFITEACEYKKSLLALKPHIAVILNAEEDHPDTYPSLEELYATFDKFIDSIHPCGVAVVSAESAYYSHKKCSTKSILSYGYEGELSYKIANIREYKNGYYRFQIYKDKVSKAEISLSVPGHHNILNATAAFAVSDYIGLDTSTIITGLEKFIGVERRFELKGSVSGADIYVDYAHHPSEIKAAITTALSLKPDRLRVVFQPHTYTRTALLFDSFLSAFDGADELYIFKEYAAREDATLGASAYHLFSGIKEQAKMPIYYYNNLIAMARSIDAVAKKGDMVLILGAGDIVKLACLLQDLP